MIDQRDVRVVVTGMGIICPLGCGVNHVWSKLVVGSSGIRALPPGFADGVPSQIAACVPGPDEGGGFNPETAVKSTEIKKMDRFITFALAAAQEAIAQAGWRPSDETERLRTATVIGSGVGGFLSITEAVRTAETRGTGRLSPFTVPSFLSNLAAGWISIKHGFKGAIGSPGTACAAGLQAIGDAVRLIRCGEADVVVCGGTDAAINRVGLGSFAAARTLSTRFNETPTAASRPFDVDRDGFVMGEGAGVLVLEALDHALAREAKPLAEILSYATTADAYHVTAGPENGEGAARAMRGALEQANLKPRDIGHLNAHATSTPLGDRAELAAIRSVFGDQGYVAISATKSATGHTLGAAGAIETIFTVMALRNQLLPPTLNLHRIDPLGDGLDIVGTTARNASFEHAVSNGFGFGGVNASIVLKRI